MLLDEVMKLIREMKMWFALFVALGSVCQESTAVPLVSLPCSTPRAGPAGKILSIR